MSVIKTECNYSMHIRTVQFKSVLFTDKNRVEHYLHLRLHGKGNRPYPCLELADSTGPMYIWWYAVPSDDGTRKEGTAISICSCIYSPEGCNPLVLLSACMSRCSAWISTKLCTIVYTRKDLAFARLCSSDSFYTIQEYKQRYQIYCTRRVSRKTYIRYAQTQTILKAK